jgi:hypothetical protein
MSASPGAPRTLDRARLLAVLGLALFLFGALLAALVFVEVQLLSPSAGYYFGSEYIHFSGFPYGTYQVAAGACLSKLGGWTPDNPVCAFFNYDQLLFASMAASFAGFVLWRYHRGR